MSEPLDERYLTWLYRQVASVRAKDPHKTYWSLLRQLYTKEFVWFVPNDDNRVEDGRDLRHEFLRSEEIYDVDPNWLGLGCSMLELLIGLSRRLSFEAEGEPRVWFWHLIGNLDLRYTDAEFAGRKSERAINAVLDRVISRTYWSNGVGGLFPLKHPDRDQRDVELWYQLCAYLVERG